MLEAEFDISERTTIKFPKPLDLKELESLFSEIPNKLRYTVHYTVSDYHRVFVRKSGSYDVKETEISGKISHPNGLESFSCSHPGREQWLFDSINFETISGLNYEDYQKKEPNIVEVWDKVRKYVNSYFQHKR